MGKRVLTTEKELELIEDYYSGIIVREIAEKYGVLRSSVDHILRRHYVVFRFPKINQQPKFDVDKASELYQKGLSCSKIADVLGVKRRNINAVLSRRGLVTRKHTRKYKCDEDFFSTYTPESCYWAGFISADGNISKRKDKNVVGILLKDTDMSHLVKFSACFHGTYPIETINRKTGGRFSRIRISCPQWKRDLLQNFNLTPNKTFTLKPPLSIPEELVWHYLRGSMDGDGSVNKGGGLVTFLSASLEFMEWVSSIVGNPVIPVIPYGSKYGKETLYKVNITPKSIYKELYKDAYSNIMMDRKYERIRARFPDVENLLKK